MEAEAPSEIRYDKAQRLLRLSYASGQTHELAAEYLRVCAPSADVRQHGSQGPEQWVVALDKEDVEIRGIDPVGQYAVRLSFSDGHDTGLYSWDVFHDLIENRERYWAWYCGRRDRILAVRDEADRKRRAGQQ